MTKTQLAKDYLLNNPHKTIGEVATACGCSSRIVDRAKEQLRSEQGIGTRSDTTFKEENNKAEYSFKTTKRIVTKEDLIAACDIDLSKWVIERWICNKWEVGRKNKTVDLKMSKGVMDGSVHDKGDIFIEPLFQIKLWLKPIHTEEQAGFLDSIKEVFESYKSEKLKVIKQTKIARKQALKATITDLHVGLDPNPNSRSLFKYEYNNKIFNQNLDKVFNSIIKEFNTHGKFDVLFLDDLGDDLDGWNGFTTRGGHSLDQNMDNVEAFKLYVTGKLRLIENIIKAEVANKVIIRSVSNDNHSGDFGHVANFAIEQILTRTYNKRSVDFIIMERFMEHFVYGDHTFILTHGKDIKHMKKGLPLILNDNTVAFVNEYIDHYNIRSKYIHLEKGDLHQVSYQRTKKFDYRNFMSFAPPTNWQQHNYGDTYTGYSIQVIPFNSSEISHSDYFFELKTV